MSATRTVFIVDDQESILSTVASVLGDESYQVQTFTSAEALAQGLRRAVPDLILLDIWLPGIDGLEALANLKHTHPKLPVILMSGHAGVDIAVKAMKIGAADFLEKPLNLDHLLDKIAMHLPPLDGPKSARAKEASAPALGSGTFGAVTLSPSKQSQCTLKGNAVLNGFGLLSGRPTGIIITPAPLDSGIVFRTLDGVVIPAHITALENFESLAGAAGNKGFTANSTTLAKGGRHIRTVEHLLAALHMMGVTNALIKVEEEIPNVDGSAADYCRIIAAAGIEDQKRSRIDIVVNKKIGVGKEDKTEKHLYVEPYDGFAVDLRVDYPAPIGEQRFHFNPTKQSFVTDIAPARSFNTFENIDMAQQKGMAGSGYLNSHIIIHDGKVINTKLNFPDEFVRHKMLDLLGDLFLLGHNLRGRVVGNMTSHGLNQSLALKIHQELSQR